MGSRQPTTRYTFLLVAAAVLLINASAVHSAPPVVTVGGAGAVDASSHLPNGVIIDTADPGIPETPQPPIVASEPIVNHGTGPAAAVKGRSLLQVATPSLYTGAESTAMLDQHNGWRCLHSAPPLTWDSVLAAEAQAWSNHLKANGACRAGGIFHSTPNGAYGENLGWMDTYAWQPDQVDIWAEEVPFPPFFLPSLPPPPPSCHAP